MDCVLPDLKTIDAGDHTLERKGLDNFPPEFSHHEEDSIWHASLEGDAEDGGVVGALGW